MLHTKTPSGTSSGFGVLRDLALERNIQHAKRFGAFQLLPDQRLLKEGDKPVRMLPQPVDPFEASAGGGEQFGNGRAKLDYQIDCRMRGYYQVGPLLLESGDLFGLHRRYRVVAPPAYVAGVAGPSAIQAEKAADRSPASA